MKLPPPGCAMAASVLLAMTTTGCVGSRPTALPPQVQLPATYGSESAASQTVAANLSTWWTTFNDPALTRLIEAAGEGNLDVQIAGQRIREARAIRSAAGTGLFPQAQVSGGYSRVRRSENGGYGPFGAGEDEGLLQSGFDLSWELDVFGGTRRAIDAAQADAMAQLEAKRDVLVSLSAEVARQYFELRAAQQQREIALRNAKLQEELLKLTESRNAAGLVSELDVTQPRVLLAQTRSRVPGFDADASRAMHALAVLLGKEPRALVAELAEPRPLPGHEVLSPPVGLPSELLLRRPDLRAAQRRIEAEQARVGVAEADLYPRFFLTAAAGLESIDADKFFDSSSLLYSVGPSIRWRIFSFGRVRREIEARQARADATRLSYEQSVLVALSEVHNALVSFAAQQARREYLDQAVAASRTSVSLASELYAKGLTDLLRVIDAQRQLDEVEETQVQASRDAAVQLVLLYKALGGGWHSDEWKKEPK